MSVAAITWAKAQQAPNAVAKAVLVFIADYADDDGVAWPSLATLTNDLQVSKRTLQRAIRLLEEAGLLLSDARYQGHGGQTSNRYCLAMSGEGAKSADCDQSDMGPVPIVAPPYELPTNLPPEADASVGNARACDDDFATWWDRYPNKVGHRKAHRAYRYAVRRLRADRAVDPAMVLRAGLERAIASHRWLDPTYIVPNPARWLSEDRWLDEDLPSPWGLNTSAAVSGRTIPEQPNVYAFPERFRASADSRQARADASLNGALLALERRRAAGGGDPILGGGNPGPARLPGGS